MTRRPCMTSSPGVSGNYLQDQEPSVALEAPGKSPGTRPPPARAKFAYPPNLVVVDGGQPQVAAASRALADLGIDDVYVVGLAKRLEEVWLPDSDFPVILPRTSQGLYLLQRIRDEAHRFAITFHRQKRGKAMTASAAGRACPGLGEAKRKALLAHFGSVKKVRAATRGGTRRRPRASARCWPRPSMPPCTPPGGGAGPVPAVNMATGEILET